MRFSNDDHALFVPATFLTATSIVCVTPSWASIAPSEQVSVAIALNSQQYGNSLSYLFYGMYLFMNGL